MQKSISLAQYVKKRNGIPMGASGSLRNMFERSFGAGSFYLFWRYWNPIWGYYLSRNVMRPVSNVLPIWLATIITFAISGGLHDLAVMLVKWKLIFFFTPWFTFMSFAVVASKTLKISFAKYHWLVRMCFNLFLVVGCYVLATNFESLYA